MKTNLNSASVSNYDPNSCHLERSERTLGDLLQKILRCAQNDKNQIHNYFWVAGHNFVPRIGDSDEGFFEIRVDDANSPIQASRVCAADAFHNF